MYGILYRLFAIILTGEILALSSVCVYCGSSNLVPQKFKDMAEQVGKEIAKRKMRLIYGGGHVGLMGIVADSALRAGTEVIGIIPEHIRAQEVQHTGLTELHVVPDMHTRKRMMAERAEAFVVLPGGLGTLDEVFEIITWKKLGLHNKPVLVFNQDGYWTNFIELVDDAIRERFAGPSDRSLFQVVDNVADLFKALDEDARPQTATLTGRM